MTMNVLLVAPEVPTSYWSFDYSLPFVGKDASLPPLGLITLAAALPEEWELRLVDLKLAALGDDDLEWADTVLAGGMLVEAESMLEVLRRAAAAGCRTAVGGPAATTSPELFADVDVVFQGEAEGRVDELVDALSAPPGDRVVLPAPVGRHPAMSSSPVPRFDLLEVDRYATMSVQYSRGCPHRCEFCDVVEVFGRVSRVKAPDQVLAELEAVRRTGYRGGVFLVDDNFIGNRASVRRLLPLVGEWQREHGRPFDFFTEASVDLAVDEELVRSMVDAGFSSVFIGIESPCAESLAEAGKGQNLRVDLSEAVESLTRAGLEVMGGFIVGFDSDDAEVFGAQRRFIQSSPIAMAMVGLLSALPGTALWRRLGLEGRLRGRPSGDQFERPNFQPAMDEGALLRGYARLLESLYSARGYYRRSAAVLKMLPARGRPGRSGGADLRALLRATVRIGLLSPRCLRFWRLMAQGLRRGRAGLRVAVEHAVKGEHLIRYTRTHVLPRIEAAVEALAGEAGPAKALATG